MCGGMDLLGLSQLRFFSASWIYRFISLAKFEKFPTFISSSTLLALPSFSSCWRTHIMQMLGLWGSVFSFPSLVSLCYSNLIILLFYFPFYWFFLLSPSPFSSFSGLLFWLFCVSVLKFLFDSFYISYFFAETFYYLHLFEVYDCSLKHFYHGCFKSVSGNDNIYAILVLAFIDYYLSCSLISYWFWLWWVIFFIDTWTFLYYVTQFWILFKPLF